MHAYLESDSLFGYRDIVRIVSAAAVTAILLTPTQAVAQSVNELYLASRVARKLTQDDRARQAVMALTYSATVAADGFHLGPQPVAAGSPILGGGKVPSNLGAPTDDGYGSALGYCAWDNGPSTSATGYLAGSNSQSAVAIAVVSPGLDGIIQTSCSDIQAGTFPRGDDSVQVARAGQLTVGLSPSKAMGEAVGGTSDLSNLPSDVPIGQVRYVISEKAFYSRTATGWEKVGGSTGAFQASLTDPAGAYFSNASHAIKIGHDTPGVTSRLSVAPLVGGYNIDVLPSASTSTGAIRFVGSNAANDALIEHLVATNTLALTKLSGSVSLRGLDSLGVGSVLDLAPAGASLSTPGALTFSGQSIALTSTSNTPLVFNSSGGAVFNGAVTAPSFVGALLGNASSATKLSNARLINGVAFDGTSDITVSDNTKLPLTGGAINGNLQISGGLWAAGFSAYFNFNSFHLAQSASSVSNNIVFSPLSSDSISLSTSGSVGISQIKMNPGYFQQYSSFTGGAIGTIDVSGISSKIEHTIPGAPPNNSSLTLVGRNATLTSRSASGVSSTMTLDGNSGFSVSTPETVSFSSTTNKPFIFNSTGGAVFDGSVTAPNFIGNLAGNSSSATKLATARLINGVPFDGTSDITISASANDNTKLPLTGGAITGDLSITGNLNTSGSFSTSASSGVMSSSFIATHTILRGTISNGSSNTMFQALPTVLSLTAIGNSSTDVGGIDVRPTRVAISNRAAVGGTSSITIDRTSGITLSTPLPITISGNVNASGNATFAGNLSAATVTQTSDARLKSDIRAINLQEMKGRFMMARPITYVLNSTGRQDYGFSAQDLNEIFPELVYANANGYYSVSYSGMVPILTAVAQEHQRSIESLKESKLDSAVDQWAKSSDGAQRFYFARGGSTMLKGYGDIPLEVRNGSNTAIAIFTNAGDLALLNNLKWMAGAALASDKHDEVAIRSMSPTRAALRLEVSNATGGLATRVLGYLFGDNSGVGIADSSGRAVLTAGARSDGSSLVTIAGDLAVSSGRLELGDKHKLYGGPDGWLNIESGKGLRIGSAADRAIVEISATGAVRAKRLEATDVVDAYTSCAGQQAQIARDSQGHVVVCQ